MMPADGLRLAVAAFTRGLITGDQLASLTDASEADPSLPTMRRHLERLGLDARVVRGLGSEPVGTLGYEHRTLPAVELASVVDQTQGAGRSDTDETAATLRALLALGLDTDRFAARYAIGEELGRGGVGRILAADDALIGRTVAVKVLHDAHAPEATLRRFVREAQVTAQLEHPNVVPVYDIGALPDGSPCFSMKWVRGRSLKAMLRALERAEALDAGVDRYRVLQVFTQICMAVEYAHSKGVIHRDLKPDNVMVGDFGEVLVMDWGIARRMGEPAEAPRGGTDPIASTAEHLTIDGSVIGTPGYMPPEQALGQQDRIDARTDVFALGAILYEVLSGERPFRGATAFAVLIETTRGEIVPPSARAPHRSVPPDLEEICLRALAYAPEDRYPSARALRDEVERYLAGTRERDRRRSEADRQVHDGEASLRAAQDLLDARADLERELGALVPLEGGEPLDQKRRRWGVEEHLREIDETVEKKRDAALRHFLRAAELTPDHRVARRHLADLHWRRYREARTANDPREAHEHLEVVARFDDGGYADRLAPWVPLTIRTDPPGAEVALYRFVERDRVLVPEGGEVLGRTPLIGARLPTGRHLIELRLPDRRAVRLPVMAWHGDELTFAFDIPDDAELTDGFVFVPPGEYMRGGDPQAVLAHPARLTWVDAFAIARFPVTCAEYFAFLDALPPEQARARSPRDGGRPLFEPDGDGRWHLPARDPDGDLWLADWPVFNVSYQDAEAYAVWRSARDGVRYRLPRDDEWEKAARGPDGRIYPWGDHFDASFCCVRGSVPEDPLPQPVGRFPLDASPYGVRDLAGGIREWVDAWFEPRHKTVRGGAYSLYPFFGRAAARWGHSPAATVPNIGLRLVKDLG